MLSAGLLAAAILTLYDGSGPDALATLTVDARPADPEALAVARVCPHLRALGWLDRLPFPVRITVLVPMPAGGMAPDPALEWRGLLTRCP